MLTLRDLHKRFGDRVAVDGLSLEVRRGEILGLLGPNGAGKSTTIHMAVGLLDPDRGEVDVDGRGSPRNPEVRGMLGVAPQAIALYEALTPEENLRFFGRVQGLSGTALAERVEWALAFAALADRRRDRTADLSGGMKRRLNMAAALVHDPALILLDEPTVGVERRIATRDPAGELSRILAAGRVDDFRVERADLEAVFLNLTGRRLRDE